MFLGTGVGELGFKGLLHFQEDFPGGSEVKKSICQCSRHGFSTWDGKAPWRWKQKPTPAFLLGKSCGQRSLTGYSPWGRKELDTTWQLNHHNHHLQGSESSLGLGLAFYSGKTAEGESLEELQSEETTAWVPRSAGFTLTFMQ